MPRQIRHARVEGGEPRVGGLPLRVAVVDLLDDDRDLEDREDLVVADAGQVAARPRGVALDDLVAREIARADRSPTSARRAARAARSATSRSSTIPRSTSGSPSALISQSNTATMRPTSSGSSITLSSLKSPWTTAGVAGSAGRCDRAATRRARPSPAAASSCDRCQRSDQPRTWRSTKPAGLPSALERRRADVDRVQIGERVDHRLAQAAARVRVARAPAAPRRGRRRRAAVPSRRTPSR